MPDKRDRARAGTQDPKLCTSPPWPWVPDIALTRNSGMTAFAKFRDHNRSTPPWQPSAYNLPNAS
jgi:hypothetical protein